MDEVKSSKRLNPKLSLKKESLKHLKVRTDLKGGIAFAANPCCTKTHHCVVTGTADYVVWRKTDGSP